MNIIDLHCDTILYCLENDTDLLRCGGHINIDKLSAGGCLAQCFALLIAAKDNADFYLQGRNTPWDLYRHLLSYYQSCIASASNRIRPAFSVSDILRNRQAGFLSSVLTVEDCVEIDGILDRFDTVYSDGVRMMTLTWNYENCIGFPNCADQQAHTTNGLKPFGFDAVEKMNDLGIIVDVSHLSEAGFYDVASQSKKPFVASHSCCRALKDHPRNLTDLQLRTIADHGGVVGVNFFDKFAGRQDGSTSIEDVVRHVLHIREKAGIDSIALGSDFDGFESRLEFTDYTGYPCILAALGKHFSDDEMEKICSGNFLRVFAENSHSDDV